MPSGWEVKAGMVCVCVASKTVRSPCYTRVISEHFRGAARDEALYKSTFTLLYFTTEKGYIKVRQRAFDSENSNCEVARPSQP